MTGPGMLPTVTADQVIEAMGALADVIRAVQINGRPLGDAVRFEPVAKTGDPIEVILAPPGFNYGGNALGPTSMTVEVFVVAIATDLTVHNLIALERGVADAIDSNRSVDATVRGSAPGVWQRGNTSHAAYVITVEVGLP